VINLVQLLRRETASTAFIPEIDGLRFLSIMMVLFFHVDQVVSEKSASLYFVGSDLNVPPISNIVKFGFQGVELFFVISGFILAVPFMRYYFGLTDRKFSLGRYFLRRLTRLEPPYILSLLLFFLIGLYFNRHPPELLVKSLISSLFYVHTIVYPGEFPFVNGVTWSLEIEVQYYLLAPFLVWLICGLRRSAVRRTVLFIAIVGFSILSWYLQEMLRVTTWSIAFYLQYFLSGILLCDLYLLEPRGESFPNGYWGGVFGIFALLFIVCVDHVASPSPFLRILSPLVILGFYALVFWNKWWSRLFSINVLTLIGGMCYTIYLLHYILIASITNRSIRYFYVENYTVFRLLQAAVLLTAVLLVSTAYFLAVEKPCMNREWPRKLYSYLCSVLYGTSRRPS
jgi:peptidoglycan/LPS O-acetylase OafA/YrhL